MSDPTEDPIATDIRAGRRLYEGFTVYTHCFRQGDRPDELWDFKVNQPQPGWTYVGWCPSAATAVPQSGWTGIRGDQHVAVMLARTDSNGNDVEVWLHVPVSQAMLDAAGDRMFKRS